MEPPYIGTLGKGKGISPKKNPFVDYHGFRQQLFCSPVFRMRSFSLLCISFFLATSPILAQCKEEPLIIGKSICLYSQTLKEDRSIFILLPEGYDTIASLPVLYLSDPEWNLNHVYGTVQYLATAQKIPPMIIVGIANKDRFRDLTPSATADFKQGGGADNFLTFITKELAPYIEKHYKASGKKILCGASLGGIFSIYALLNDSNFFDAYFAISPSLWYADGEILKDFQAFEGDFKVKKLLYITLANEKGMKVDDFIKQLRRKKIKGLKWKYERHLEETHGTIGHESVFDGLKWMFEN